MGRRTKREAVAWAPESVHLLKGRCLPLGGAHVTRGHQVHSWRLGVCLRTGDQLPTRVQACPNSSEPCSLQLLCVGLHVGRLLALQIGGSAPDQSRWAEILGLGLFSQ